MQRHNRCWISGWNRAVAALLGICLILGGFNDRSASAATPDEIQQSIRRGTVYLQRNANRVTAGAKSLVGLAMLKGGVPPESPEIREVAEAIRKKIDPVKGYAPSANNFYETGIDAYFLAEADPVAYRRELEAVTKYLVEKQLAVGSWDYHVEEGGQGDTSCTQYACLGLWAAARNGIPIDASVWEKVLRWHIAYQNEDGGYGYCPKTSIGNASSQVNMSLNAIASLQIAAINLDPDANLVKGLFSEQKKVEQPKDNSPSPFLKAVTIENPEEAAKPVIRTTGKIPPEAARACQRTLSWVVPRYGPRASGNGTDGYYFYSLERMSSLSALGQIGNRDWYADVADEILKKQGAGGECQFSTIGWYGTEVDTAFCVLFLSRATGKLLKRAIMEPGFGQGILAGGRGLSDDLMNPGANSKIKKEDEPLDKLLASLTLTNDIDIEEVQQQIIEQVQIKDRTALIGQLDQLIKLVRHPNPEIRKTAIWAIGRSDNLDLGTYLIDALDDPDLGVIVEAQNALCWLSRKPLGFGLAEDPLDELPPAATEQQKKDAISVWHKKLLLAWGPWYLDHRPFTSQGDEFESQLRLKLDRIKMQGQLP